VVDTPCALGYDAAVGWPVRRLDRWFGLTGAPLSGKEQEKHVKLPLYIFKCSWE